ncbi:MAG: hypothetical protein IJ064_04250 [Bacteroidaceae bacterium]|nr:hypothetical protein [Bacteroidaceae bacterium]
MNFKFHIFALFGALLLSACHHSDTPRPEASLGPFRSVAIVYIVAENSLSSYAEKDLSEMRRGVRNIPDSCLLAIYIDDSNSATHPRILLLDNQGEERILHTLETDPVSTDSTTMQQVLNLIISRCPARHYGLTLWSHGSGWVPQEPTSALRKTIGVDNGHNTQSNTGKEMEISTLAHILSNTGRSWEYVFFDACFMQGVEVAYELRHAAHWCIGSPAEIPGNGAPYHMIMPHLFADSTQAWRIAEEYFEYYRYAEGLVISAVRTSQLEALAEATARGIAGLPQYPDVHDVQPYMGIGSAAQWKPEYFDMGSAMGHWLTEEEYQQWRQVANCAVPYQYASNSWATSFSRYFTPVITDRDHICGLSMYIPVPGHRLNDYFATCSWYRAAGWQ